MRAILIILFIISETLQQHPIFCSEEILNAVADSNRFKDSKEFVDLTLSVPVEVAQ